MFSLFNPNPVGRKVGDCAVRAVAKALNKTWEEAYVLLMTAGFRMGDMPSSNSVWGAVLRQNGFKMKAIPDTCPDCYTAEDFCEEVTDPADIRGSVMQWADIPEMMR